MSSLNTTTPSLKLLEDTVRKGFEEGMKGWNALRMIQDGDLYKTKGYETFKQYLIGEWDVQFNYAEKMIAAASTRERLEFAVPNDPDLAKIKTERQLREFRSVPDVSLTAVFDRAATIASDKGSKTISSSAVKKAREELLGVTPPPAPSVSSTSGTALSDPVIAGAKLRALDFLAKIEFQLGNLKLDSQLSKHINAIKNAVEAIK
tara:strand:- start:81 stop:695 length:615 start_codon:yes stop_codon:yes gene_type:complete